MLTNIENECVKSTLVAVGKFAKCITDREKTVLSNKCLPPRLYSSSFNPILASNEYALGNGKKDDVLKTIQMPSR